MEDGLKLIDFAFNIPGELEPRIIEAIDIAQAEKLADTFKIGVPVRIARREDYPKTDFEKVNFY